MSDHAPLRGANCADLHPIAIEKYLNLSNRNDEFAKQFGKAICDNCVVQQQCLDIALITAQPDRGIVAGKETHEIKNAQRWQRYEEGKGPQPREPRPAWLEAPINNVVELPGRQPLTPEQRQHWRKTMNDARRAYAYAKRQLEEDDALRQA